MAGQDKTDRRKLEALRQLLQKWRVWLLAYAATSVTAIFVLFWLVPSGGTGPSIDLLGAALTAFLGFLGLLVSKYLDLKKHYIEIENEIIDHEVDRRKRLVAFQAEINGNMVVLAESFSPANRQKFTELVLKSPHQNRFSRADTTNPIYQDNREKLYEFSRATIEVISEYYNLESNLNLAIDALLLEEFRALDEAQKINWHIYTLGLVNEVAQAGAAALNQIKLELGYDGGDEPPMVRRVRFPDFKPEPDIEWTAVSKDELEPLYGRLTEIAAK